MNELACLGQSGDGTKLSSHVKLKLLKAKIKEWYVHSKNNERAHKQDVVNALRLLQEKTETGNTSPEDRESRIKLLQGINKMDYLEAQDLIQKARIKWDLEGDENTKFFHSLVNKKRRSNLIHGIMHEGSWVSEPHQVKEAFLNFFKGKFQENDNMVNFPSITNASGLCSFDRDLLENDISLVKIKTAVWNCGSNKAPDPDGFSFAFVKRFWDILKLDIFEFVNSFFTSCKMPAGSNSSFISLIPKVSNPIHIKDFCPISLIGIHYKIIANRLSKVIDKIVSHEQSAFIAGRPILDGPLMLSEMIDWYKNRKKKMLIFKVDFEKAFDSVSWRYLDFMLYSHGFGVKWRSWIRECLVSSITSILVNGSPTSEFSIKRSLRQGDPLSLFMFILVMEGLHVALSDAVQSGLIYGVKFGPSPSHCLAYSMLMTS
ncbi:putative RNA-directed DNA polymerase, eukaryota, reverse transcriptase zinc-binding domain protein [Tanacetum coccineum]|uniref:RNA-directed DNA polymerase, eukaryota, reverse transcriptase zinc-binding domain protein n=1 Tax=Tanacetum coccineum TaxID=301880 RepID=A0ABQ5CT02_9ASTR